MGTAMQQGKTTTLIVLLLIRLRGGEFNDLLYIIEAPLAGRYVS